MSISPAGQRQLRAIDAARPRSGAGRRPARRTRRPPVSAVMRRPCRGGEARGTGRSRGCGRVVRCGRSATVDRPCVRVADGSIMGHASRPWRGQPTASSHKVRTVDGRSPLRRRVRSRAGTRRAGQYGEHRGAEAYRTTRIGSRSRRSGATPALRRSRSAIVRRRHRRAQLRAPSTYADPPRAVVASARPTVPPDRPRIPARAAEHRPCAPPQQPSPPPPPPRRTTLRARSRSPATPVRRRPPSRRADRRVPSGQLRVTSSGATPRRSTGPRRVGPAPPQPTACRRGRRLSHPAPGVAVLVALLRCLRGPRDPGAARRHVRRPAGRRPVLACS